MVVRRDVDVESLGIQAALPPDFSPLKVGTTGTFAGESFTLIGRVRIGYSEGSWSEWCADFGNGKWGWIAESQGYFMVSIEVAPPQDFPGMSRMTSSPPETGAIRILATPSTVGRESLPLGAEVTVAEQAYRVCDVKETAVIGSDGELPFVAKPGRRGLSVDLQGPEAAFANAEYSEDGIRLFLGRSLRFEDLQFGNLRLIPGWTTEECEPTRNQSTVLACPSCGAAVQLRAAGLSMSATCGSCGTLLDSSNPVLQLLDGLWTKHVLVPKIPIGNRGVVDGVEYECVGCLRRSDPSGEKWMEHLLFNPFNGYRWLVYFQGHWSWIQTLLEGPNETGNSRIHDGTIYRLFSSGTALVEDVIGEFYWKVRRGEETQVTDYIAPPRVLSSERYADLNEETWSEGRYMSGTEVFSAFKLEGEPRRAEGVYLNQPNPYAGKTGSLMIPALIAAAVLTAIQLESLSTGIELPLVSSRLEYNRESTNQTLVTPTFVVPGTRSQPLTVVVSAPVNNAWVDTELSLLNLDTQEVKLFEAGVGYYSGYDDGNWSEGSKDQSKIVPAVQPGRYVLRMAASADSSIDTISVSVVVKRGATIWSNWLIALFGVFVVPGFRWIRFFRFEACRWQNSSIPLPAGHASDDADDDDDD
jgi:hypothetical protein